MSDPDETWLKGDDGGEISEVWGGLTIGGWSGVWGVIDGAQRLEERWEWGVGGDW
ncbi:thaumatin-like protein 1 [Pyrus ussuriensis x Pyrus communis]|uniref:Thaumatin-like protein 1 n=1 Tax=Pyrus ussuriensis x Pyrus communis TaxID=2448454 RepID=A0A5N5G5G9_9ROSA|nr:thaumatin-like protein 1 [Pyrus ussuriensis x Pyrus communis]